MKVIISLASFGARLTESAYRSVNTLLDQNIDTGLEKIILWVNGEAEVPWRLKTLSQVFKRFEIRQAPEDLGPLSKLVWALKEYPEHTIITADDDMYYPRNWYMRLISTANRHPSCVVAYHAKWVKKLGITTGAWRGEQAQSEHESFIIFPHGDTGILYPPGSLHPDATNLALIKKLSRGSSDAWFWAMMLLQRTKCCCVPFNHSRPISICEINTAGGTSLWRQNQVRDHISLYINQIINHYPELQKWLQDLSPEAN